jgi:hypothetical protein
MATNDLADLKTKLGTALRDTSNQVWTASELGDLLTWSAASLYPRLAIPTMSTLASVDDTETYDLPAGVREISAIDWIDENGKMVMRLMGGTWEIQGDPLSDAATLFINRIYSDGSHSFLLHGYKEYDLVTNLPPDRYVPLVMARARAEAYRRALGDRAKFQQWQALNQTQNISVNEMIQMVNDAEMAEQRLEKSAFTWRKPKPA